MGRNQALLNLACSALNEAVDRSLIDLNAQEDSEGQLDATLFGKPSKIGWRGIGHGELAFTVWWNIKPGCKGEPFDRPLNKRVAEALDAFCTVWIERKTGKWIQAHGKGGLAKGDAYLSQSALLFLGKQPDVIPHGYEREGRFFR